MSVYLFSDVDSCAQTLASLVSAAGDGEPGLSVLLANGAGTLAEPLRAALPDLLVVDVASPRFGRLNFDAVALVVLDLPAESLLSPQGRRLVEALGRLAQETLALALVGETTALAGGALLDGIHAGLSLLPGTAVIPRLHLVNDLRTLLARLSERGVRLLAMDGSVGVRYDGATDRVLVDKSTPAAAGGSVLLAAFVPGERGGVPTARLHVLSPGMEAAWPA